MTALAAPRLQAGHVPEVERGGQGWVVALGLLALASAPVGWMGLAVTVVAGILGIVVPVARGGEKILDVRTGDLRPSAAVAVLGLAAVGAARGLVPLPPVPIGASAVPVIVVAAVAEEAFFRRLAFGWLSRWGIPAALLLTSAAFAVVHVPAYGAAALPVDLAAGLLFGWQRWATGSWIVPAVTHAAANLLQAL